MSTPCATLFGMAIQRMLYVTCDTCGTPAGGTDDMADDAREALTRARQLGFRRRRHAGRMVDFCRLCRLAIEQAGGL